jgi:hypothetical protein
LGLLSACCQSWAKYISLCNLDTNYQLLVCLVI